MRRRARILQVAHDLSAPTFADLRVLDLAVFDGQFSFEFAARGAQVVGIEGRRANLELAEAERRRLGYANVTFIEDDVRNLSLERYGLFDIVLCLGIAYHLDAPDVFQLFERVAEVCTDFAIVDTHVAVRPDQHVIYREQVYAGWSYYEGDEADAWAGLGNARSFWLSRASLYNALAAAGFSSVLEVHNPAMNDIRAAGSRWSA